MRISIMDNKVRIAGHNYDIDTAKKIADEILTAVQNLNGVVELEQPIWHKAFNDAHYFKPEFVGIWDPRENLFGLRHVQTQQDYWYVRPNVGYIGLYEAKVFVDGIGEHVQVDRKITAIKLIREIMDTR